MLVAVASAVASVVMVVVLAELKKDGTAEKTLTSLKVLAMKYQDANLEVGIFENATYDNGKGKSIPVAGVAAVQELGSVKRNIPARSFFRTTAEEKRNPWRELFRDGVEASIHHGVEPAQVMEGVGLQVVGDIKAKITEIKAPPLADATAKRKGHEKPLIESKLLINSITHSVGEAGDDSGQ